MTPPDHSAPGARLATDDAGAAEIDRILARRRAELARLGLAARTALRRCEQAEARVAEREVGEGEPTDLLTVVDSMIERALRGCAEAVDEARRSADETVARAVADSIEHLRRAGLDASRLPAARRPSPGTGAVTPPPSAGELWHRVGSAHVSEVRPDAPVSAPQVRSVGRAEPLDGDAAMGDRPPVALGPLPGSSLPVPDGLEELGPVAVATLVADPASGALPEGSPVDAGDAAFDSFWQEASRERRVRDRFRRRGREDA